MMKTRRMIWIGHVAEIWGRVMLVDYWLESQKEKIQ
jgi:hypothetical protein